MLRGRRDSFDYRGRMLDPGKRRQRAHVQRAIDGFRCEHGRPVTLCWHPHRADGWFDVEAHCERGRIDATRLAADALASFPT
jgi:hypothetical protein